jgi:hypothetical protein
MYALLTGFGFPVPALRAVYRSQRPSSVLTLGTPSELADFLRAPGSLPIYLKPSLGSYGRGNVLIQGIDGSSLVLGDRSTVSISDFCRELDDARGLGWILQEPLTSHSRIASVCGEKVSGLRIHSFLGPDGPELVKAIFKINVGKSDSDNFRHGQSGNLVSAVDLEKGVVTRVVSGTAFCQVENPSHPLSGQSLVGFQLPYWSETKKLVCQASLAFQGFVCPGWDIAVCEDGPKILEVNFLGDVDLSQFAYKRGFLDERFMALMGSLELGNLLTRRGGRGAISKKNGRVGVRKHHWRW